MVIGRVIVQRASFPKCGEWAVYFWSFGVTFFLGETAIRFGIVSNPGPYENW